MNRKKLLTFALCLCVISTLVITAAASAIYKYSSASGQEISKTINRVDISVTDTEFTYENVGSDGMLTCTTTVSIGKTEADFYGMLNSITVSGAQFGYTIYTAGKNNPDSSLPEEIALTYDKPLEWQITFTVPYEQGKNVYEIELAIDYTTGLKPNTAQRYQTTVPLTLTVK